MRRLILIAALAIALGACGRKQQETNEVTGENLTAESIGTSNDVTAIDAVTGDAANMAADVDMNYGNLEENGVAPVSNGTEKPATPRTKAPGKPPLETPAPAEPVTNNAA